MYVSFMYHCIVAFRIYSMESPEMTPLNKSPSHKAQARFRHKTVHLVFLDILNQNKHSSQKKPYN